MEEALKFIAKWRLGDIASIVSLVVVIIGFILTNIGVHRSRKAAEEARKAIARFDTISAVSAAIQALEEIKTLHRGKDWHILPHKYSEVRRSLVAIRAANPNFSSEHKTGLMNAITQLANMENEMDRLLAVAETVDTDIAGLNAIIGRQTDTLSRMLVEIKRTER
ncbi:MAG: hypothetical protein AB1473_08500 [Thermodesulfobacteriota bacterium]